VEQYLQGPIYLHGMRRYNLSLHKQKHGKVETRVEIRQKVRQERNKQNKGNNEKWTIK